MVKKLAVYEVVGLPVAKVGYSRMAGSFGVIDPSFGVRVHGASVCVDTKFLRSYIIRRIVVDVSRHLSARLLEVDVLSCLGNSFTARMHLFGGSDFDIRVTYTVSDVS